ncbi:helix-turn-helix transcriptional regulator [Acaryochloris marina]|uniref:Transcriptional regulator, AraC family n=1 Tax=Acaryochloris marina (strain MBIC 11017) TaxID=329726 RepID=A8ZKS5_ACAM1|nr:AraC family transcriptional regulator [Acaryochloris marina]ABW31393.1 transcriptional regulator, AraC family [Acaryochloris marina MBIC11017]
MATLQLTLSSSNLYEMLAESQQQIDADYQIQADPVTWSLQQSFGDWLNHSFQLREGLDLVFTRANLRENLHFTESFEKLSIWGLRFHLAGHSRLQLHSNQAEILTRPHTNMLGFMSGEMQVNTTYPAHQCVEMLTLVIHPQLFATFIPEDCPLGSIGHNIARPFSSDFNLVGHTSASMLTPLQQILHCPYQGAIKRTYLESKALELIALKLNQVSESRFYPEDINLKTDDIERIYLAKEILLDNMDNPLSLVALAKQAGINDFKLKRGFRQIFGTTVFGCLRQHRMEQAQRLLESYDLSISQISQAVGYASPSQFSAAFKKTFGYSPSSYRAL